MEGLNCSICCLDFNDSTVIPKILKCGHTFCLSCLEQLFVSNRLCPKCRGSISGDLPDYSTNFDLLDVVKQLDSSNKREEIFCKRLQTLKNEIAAIEEELTKTEVKTKINLEKVKIVFDRIENLSQEGISASNKETEDKIAGLEAEYQKLRIEIGRDYTANMPSVSIDFRNYARPKPYLREIYRLLQHGHQLFSIAKLKDGIRYGRVTSEDGLILIHCLDLMQMPEGGKSVKFQDLKDCIDLNVPFRAFLKMPFNEHGYVRLVQIELFGFKYEQVVNFCTGEDGLSYKDSILNIHGDWRSNYLLMSVTFLRYNDIGVNDPDYEKKMQFSEYSCELGEVVISGFSRGNFRIIYHDKHVLTCSGAVGKITYPTDFIDLIDPLVGVGDMKIIDCGFLFEC